MDTTSVMLSMLFGTVGMGFVMYGKKAGRLVPAVSGLGLMICPYVVNGNGLLLVVGLVLTAIPLLLRGE